MKKTIYRKGRLFYLCLLALVVSVISANEVLSEEKSWSGTGDGETWTNATNWFPSEVPAASDEVLINAESAAVVAPADFSVKSVTVGGGANATLSVENVVEGTITPAATSDIGMTGRSGGTITLRGSGGFVKLKGQYQDAEGSAASEPSFIFWLE